MYSHGILGHFSSPPDHIQLKVLFARDFRKRESKQSLSFEGFIGNLYFFFFFFFTNNVLTPGNVPHIITHVGG